MKMKKEMPYFRRKLYDKMLRWKQERNGETALLIKGARRVGKSTLALQFARNEYDSYLLIDFSKSAREVATLFDDLSSLDYLFLRLKLLYGVELTERRSCIIFDEVQMCPQARQAIKHLVADGRYDYIETGSLLSIKKNVEKIVIPSEETRLELQPMDYEEFCWALGDTTTVPLIRTFFESKKGLTEAIHRQLMRKFRLYMLVGGMPQAVAKYLETNSFSAVDAVKREIIQLYEDDFNKIDTTGRSSLLFDAIPAQLQSNARRYQLGKVVADGRANRLETVIADMRDSMTVALAFHANDPNVGMAASKNIDFYKIFLADTGLFVTLAFKDKDFTENVIYEKLLSNKISANLGYLYENVVAQMIRASGHELYYHTWAMENSNHHYEIDFLLTVKDKICPIEVKSSGYKTHTSLDQFSKKFSARIKDKYLIYTKDLHKERDVLFLPVYMTGLL